MTTESENQTKDASVEEKAEPLTMPEEESGRLERTLMKMGVIGELLLLFATGSRWWMAPLVLLLAITGLILVVLQSFEYVAPFIYVAF